MPTMPIITDAEILEIRRRAAELPPSAELAPIKTRAELFAYCISVAREKGWDEVAVVDGLLKIATPYREHVREVEQLLRPLGYTAVADHLRKVARHLQSRPPGRWVNR